MLVREVFGWLRFCLQHDPLCCACRVVVEEIPSGFQNWQDVTDGPRTLAIYSLDKGMTPRIEIRFTGERPQVYCITGDKEEYIISPTSSRFPGDFRQWSRAEFVQYLVDYAKAKLCSDVQSLITVIPTIQAKTEVGEEIPIAAPKISFDHVQRIVNAAKRATEKKSSKVTQLAVKDYLKKNAKLTSIDPVNDFANSVWYYFMHNKLKWDDLDVLENEDGKGQDIVPWGFFLQRFSDPKAREKLPATVLDRLPQTPAYAELESTIEKMVEARNRGESPEVVLEGAHPGELAQRFEGAFASNALPLPYLDLLQKVDRRERIAPWSMIRRSVLAYEAQAASEESLEEAVLAWLDASELYPALYRAEDGADEASLRELVRKRISSFVEQTVANPLWVKAAFTPIVGKVDLERQRALQMEFDMWLLQALSPSVTGSHMPLTPHAYNLGKEEEDLYNRICAAWLGTAKQAKERRKEVSLKLIGAALSSFYKQLNTWSPDNLADYLPKTPSFREITTAVQTSDKEQLLNLLLADVEDELGVEVPSEVRAQLAEGPFLSQLFDEMRFQALSF